MSGGGSKKDTTSDTGGVAAIEPQYMSPQAVTYPQQMPGQLSAIGHQLAAGFGGQGGILPNGYQGGAYTAFLDNLYAPQTAYLLQQPLGVSKEMAAGKPSTGNSTLDALLGIAGAANTSKASNGSTGVKKPEDQVIGGIRYASNGGGIDR